MDKEQFVIDRFKSPFLGDDGAVIGAQVFSKDLFVEGTHFLREWLSMREIGYKAMVVNFSDTIVMNAVPRYALLGLGLPKDITHAEISQLKDGIQKACDEYGVSVIGGDTIKSDKIFISVSVVGYLLGRAVYRKGLQNSDFIAYTGRLGSSLKGLNALLRSAKINKNFNENSKISHRVLEKFEPKNRVKISPKSRFIKPILRAKFFYQAAKFINSAMDISDGLAQDLPKLCKSARLGYKFTHKPLKQEFLSGEEYEILFSFSPKNLSAIKRIATKNRLNIKIFAKAVKGSCKNNVRKHHF